MKISETKVILKNQNILHRYFAWPSVARLRDGRLAVVASGFRNAHVCPFGKGVISFSTDEGETWTPPAVVIDTPLDDRDCGICAFGESSVIVTSFNNSIKFQRRNTENLGRKRAAYYNAYLDMLEDMLEGSECEEKYLGSTFVISHDNGNTFGEIMCIPITSPHGPLELPDGDLLYVGRKFSSEDAFFPENMIASYRVKPNGEYEKLCEVESLFDGELCFCEPHAVLTKDNTILLHIRVQRPKTPEKEEIFTLYQCYSYDFGKSFTRPYQILPQRGGAPSHLLRHSSGALISTYSKRTFPYGIMAMISNDDGKTWDTHRIYENRVTHDLGYPCSVERKDGSILTVFYAHKDDSSPAEIMQTCWTL